MANALSSDQQSRAPTVGDSDDRDDRLLRRLYPSLRRFAAVCAAPWMDPDDLLQEAVTRTLAIHQLTDLDNPAAYLRKATANAARNEARSRNRPAPATAASTSDTYPSDLSLLSRLSVDERAAVYLLDIERFTISEAAGTLGGTTAAVKTLAARGRRKLRRIEGAHHGR
jgi:DNA-directed RNA polymerase specialized sigma24 family protein